MYNQFSKVTPAELEDAENELSKQFKPFETFGVFICKIEDTIDITEAANYPFTPQ